MRKKDDEKVKSIKDAVIKLILQEGFHGTSVSKIAKMAGVSPATVYIYFENKEDMLHDIYLEYSEEIYDYLLDSVKREMEGRQQIEVLIRSYYNYILENKEIFSFVEQFSNCPSLANNCSGKKGICNIYSLMSDMKKSNLIRNYKEDNLLAIIFQPVKAIAVDNRKNEAQKEDLLQEMIQMIQDAILL
ncbi:TetR/AcrR family transcriptional regulator [Lacrimispora sp.]|uniref:TetR/AcrR family transcriptional regulator n=1 Tax=Lacrimispora sp. TaxID=2719234 RepID=UPI0028ABE902|nr:TetR/AcrR family transcriptional regulator [Lacrimispora sp.]